jgi:hypothetical protein
LFAGVSPPVQSTVTGELFEVDVHSADAQASEPRPDDRIDTLAFDAAQPAGPYTLTQLSDPGPRRVRLTSNLGDRITLSDSEVQFDPEASQQFTLRLRADRDLTGINGVQVLYSVTAVFTKIQYGQDLILVLQSTDPATLERATALAVAVVALNWPQLVAAGHETLQAGNYGAQIEIKSLQLVRGTTPTPDTRRLQFRAEIELKATRALGADEGRPIQRIFTPSQLVDPRRRVDIKIDVEA